MTDRQLRIYRVYDEDLPLAAKMQGSKISIAGDVSELLGETVTYAEIDEAIKVYTSGSKDCLTCVLWVRSTNFESRAGRCTRSGKTTYKASTCQHWKKS